VTIEPTTRPSLLIRIRDAADHDAWNQFVEVYASLIHHFARRKGLQEADAADITQDVLRQVSDSIGRFEYTPNRGSFRAWLFTVTRNRILNFFSRDGRGAKGSGDTSVRQLLEQQPAAEEQADWDREVEQHLFACAVERVRPEFRENSWQAFWKTAVESHSASDTAAELGASVGAVYIAKSRVLARLKEVVASLGDGESLGL
jgi:RNA polymerase sigma factor (sigma-70 family)